MMIHRGPDDEGIYAKGQAGLGMRRLSIIDLAGGRQPIHNEDKTIWAVLNGEIYNFPELSKGLMRSGHHLHTRCDTEVIPHLYEDFGAAFVKKLRGMFALALYDERQRKLLLARDRLGEKPLFYALSRERLLFGSEIKALLAAAPELIEVNREALLEFFTFGYVADPHTSFVGIKKLPPGHLLEFRDGKIEITQYWDLPAYGTSQPSIRTGLLGGAGAPFGRSCEHPDDQRCPPGCLSERRRGFVYCCSIDVPRQLTPNKDIFHRIHQ